LWNTISTLHKRRKEKQKKLTFRRLRDWIETHNADKIKTAFPLLLKMSKMTTDVEASLEFVQRRMVERALTFGMDCLAEPEGITRIGAVRDGINDAIKIGVHKSRFYPYRQQIDERRTAVRSGQISCGFSKKFDTILGGGICPGEVGIFLGPTGRGKTQILCNLAAYALLQGKNVLYCTLQDITAPFIARRVDQIILGWSERKILRAPDRYAERLREKLGKNPGELFIRDYTDQGVNYYDIRAAIEYLEDAKKRVDLVLIDYLDTMSGHSTAKDDQVVFREIISGLRRLGRDKKFAVWTASQGNRASLDVEEVKISQVAGAIAKMHAADVVVGMSQTPEMKDEGYLKFHILKTRMAATHDHVFVISNPITMRMAGKGGIGQ
jgi:archaellum biogenesis ATPase FlaH